MYQYGSNSSQGKLVLPNAKKITDIIPPKYKTIRAAFLYGAPDEDRKSNVQLTEGERLLVLDFEGRFVKVKATNDEGKVRSAWVRIEDTNIDYNELMFQRIAGYIETHESELGQHLKTFEEAAVADYNKKNPGMATTFEDIPKYAQENYQEIAYDPFLERQKNQVQSKKDFSKKVMDDLNKIYSFDKIFSAEKMQADQSLDKTDRKFADAKNGNVSFDVGYYPNWEKGENSDNFLDMGEEMTATMEVLYNPEKKDNPQVDKITLNYPLVYFLNNMKYREGHSTDQYPALKREKIEEKIGLLAIMVAHEYIHTAQNTMKKFSDIAKLPNLDPKEVERRKTMREILAHHHSIFPNKKYEDPTKDPVFAGTDFVRGETAIFDGQSHWVQAFLIWMAMDFVRRYEGTKPSAELSEKYEFTSVKNDFTALRDQLAEQYNIDFSLGKEAFKSHLVALAKKSGKDFVPPEEKMTPREIELKKELEEKEKEAEKKEAEEKE